MDDNYSSELAALERLAQAEEADRQRVVAGLCDWCGVNPAQRPNGECDDCWHMPGHEGEYEPTLEEEAYRQRFEALERENARLLDFVRRVVSDYEAINRGVGSDNTYIMIECMTNNQREVIEGRKLLKSLDV